MDSLLNYYRRLRRAHLYLIGLSVLLVSVLALTAALDSLDHWFHDRTLAWSAPSPSADIVIVAIDEASLRELEGWPWRRATLAALVESLSALGARSIFLDLLLNQPDLASPADDRLLAEAMAAHGRVFLPVHVDTLEPSGQPIEILPAPRLAETARALGHVSLEPCPDGVLRKVWLYAGARQAWWPHMALAVTAGSSTDAVAARERLRDDQGGTIARAMRRHIPWVGATRSFQRVTALDLLAGRVPARTIRDRDVLVGVTAPVVGDHFRTPVAERVSGVEVNANILQAVQQGRLFRRAGQDVALVANLLLGLIVPVLLPFLRPRRGTVLMLGIVVLVPLVQWGVLSGARIWLPLGPALAVSVLAWVLWTWRRLYDQSRFYRSALDFIVDPTPLRRRMTSPGRFGALIRMMDRVLPVEAWRLERMHGHDVQTGGKAVNERAWQSARARHYSFTRDGANAELTLLWRDAEVPAHLDHWVKSMVRRMNDVRPAQRSLYPVTPLAPVLAAGRRTMAQAPVEALESILETLTAGVVLCDACGTVVFANRQAMVWLDLAPDQLETLHLHDLPQRFAPPQREDWRQAVYQAMQSGAKSVFCRDPEGAVYQVNLRTLEAGERPGTSLLITLQDVTDAATATRVRDEVLDYMSHDMRSPLISALALLEKARLGPPEKILSSDVLNGLEQNVRRGLSVSEQLLQLARLASTPKLPMVELDMLPVVESALERAQALEREHDVRLRFRYDERVPVWVLGNHETLERLLVNLLENAIRHSHRGNSVEVTLDADDESVSCEIRDRGAGVAPELLERIFESAGDSGTRDIDYSLRYVRLAAERHGGRVRASSRPGEGTRYVLRLPRVTPEELDATM